MFAMNVFTFAEVLFHMKYFNAPTLLVSIASVFNDVHLNVKR